MSMFAEATAAGASQERDATHKFVVSLWYIPGSCDYVNARVCKFFFVDREPAEEFSRRWSNPPEMADCYDLSDPRVNEIFSIGAKA